MLVRFTKNPPAAKADSLTCVGVDGLERSLEMPRQGVLPREAIVFVVEATLGLRGGWFSEAAGGVFDSRRSHAGPTESVVIAECLQAEQWGGGSSPGAFAAKVAEACHQKKIAGRTLKPDDVERLRKALRDFGAAWRPLPAGGTLERTL